MKCHFSDTSIEGKRAKYPKVDSRNGTGNMNHTAKAPLEAKARGPNPNSRDCLFPGFGLLPDA
jgi:hypothetical protein